MNSKALIRAATLTVAWVAIATIGSEVFATFKGLLSAIGGHHWIGKSALTLVFMVVFYLLFSRINDDELSLKDTWLLILTNVISGLAIMVFYVLHA